MTSELIIKTCSFVLLYHFVKCCYRSQDGCETRWDHIAKPWWHRCHHYMQQQRLEWSSLWEYPSSLKDTDTINRGTRNHSQLQLELYQKCSDDSVLAKYHKFSPIPQRVERAFVIDALWDFNYHHFLADSVARLISNLRYLQRHPDVKVHVRAFE